MPRGTVFVCFLFFFLGGGRVSLIQWEYKFFNHCSFRCILYMTCTDSGMTCTDSQHDVCTCVCIYRFPLHAQGKAINIIE